MLKRSLQVTLAGVFPHVTMQGSQICFFSRPECISLIMKNRVKSVFFSSDKFISNFTVVNNMKITSVCMRTSGEKERVSDEAERVQSVSLYSNKWFHTLI